MMIVICVLFCLINYSFAGQCTCNDLHFCCDSTTKLETLNCSKSRQSFDCVTREYISYEMPGNRQLARHCPCGLTRKKDLDTEYACNKINKQKACKDKRICCNTPLEYMRLNCSSEYFSYNCITNEKAIYRSSMQRPLITECMCHLCSCEKLKYCCNSPDKLLSLNCNSSRVSYDCNLDEPIIYREAKVRPLIRKCNCDQRAKYSVANESLCNYQNRHYACINKQVCCNNPRAYKALGCNATRDNYNCITNETIIYTHESVRMPISECLCKQEKMVLSNTCSCRNLHFCCHNTTNQLMSLNCPASFRSFDCTSMQYTYYMHRKVRNLINYCPCKKREVITKISNKTCSCNTLHDCCDNVTKVLDLDCPSTNRNFDCRTNEYIYYATHRHRLPVTECVCSTQEVTNVTYSLGHTINVTHSVARRLLFETLYLLLLVYLCMA